MPKLPRRNVLAGAGALGLGALFPGAAKASPLTPSSPVAARRLLTGGVCPMVLQQIQGPFYLDLGLIRDDITEGLPGLPVTLIFLVVDKDTCQPIPGAVVDVWQNNALGNYSGFSVKGTLGETWLRGIQIANSDGLVVFQSIYPGWYQGRTTHIHLKVRPDETTEATTQMYFEDWISDLVYQNVPPYTQKGPKDTTNDADGFYQKEMKGTFLPNPDGSLSLWAGTILGV
ncbi:MAG: intradiol ring-cleavage dioxygenase [Planctomycetota bacterium]